MKKAECLQAVKESGVVAVIRAGGPDELLQITRAFEQRRGAGAEITMTSPGAIETIKTAVEELGDEAIIGVGSVLGANSSHGHPAGAWLW